MISYINETKNYVTIKKITYYNMLIVYVSYTYPIPRDRVNKKKYTQYLFFINSVKIASFKRGFIQISHDKRIGLVNLKIWE